MYHPKTTLRMDAEFTALCERATALARSFDHDYVGVEHYFLSLRTLPAGHPVLRTLSASGLNLPDFWAELERMAKVVTGRRVPAILPNTPRSDRVMAIAESLARTERVAEMGLMHFLFAVAQERESLPARLLAQRRVTPG